MSGQFEISDSLLKELLDAPLGQVMTVLGENINCKFSLDIIEQNTPKPGTEFERKVVVSASGLPLIRAIIRFDKNKLPSQMVSELLKRRKMIGSLLSLNEIPNKKNVTSLYFDTSGKNLFRTYEIKNGDDILFEVSEEIKLDQLNSIRDKCLLPN